VSTKSSQPHENPSKTAPGRGEHILIAEDDPLNLDILRRRVERFGYSVTTTGDGGSAWLELQKGTYDLVLLDMMMPIMDGFELLQHLRNDPRLSLVPVLMISGVDQEDSIARCIEAGADDYLMKPVNPIFLRARIGACLERKRLRDLEQRTHAALLESQSYLAEELAEASRYVSCLLPKPLSHPDVAACWHFQSCSQIGGDGFGYRWIDRDHWAFFLFDVCGHGVGAAMLSISILNVLRTLSLPETDFKSPQSVLTGLNVAFPMEAHNEQYFTCWYGVYSPSTRQLRFGSAGHPPALCIEGGTCIPLRTQGPPIGAMDDARFREESRILTQSCRLIVISDGVYELEKSDGTTATVEDFSSWYVRQGDASHPLAAWEWAKKTCVREKLDDDFSIMEIRFMGLS
jgi:sigma-B regulation protein RsbU (phosphoserine phosphatase)